MQAFDWASDGRSSYNRTVPETHRMERPPTGHAGTAASDVAGDDTTESVPVAASPPSRAYRCPACRRVFSGEARFCPFDGDALVPAPDYSPSHDPLLGKILGGRYRVESVLGEGGMGTVYRVAHVALDRHFALKILRRDVAQDPELCARFLREAKAAAAIGHPNIVAVSDFGELEPAELGVSGSTRVPYFVMELLRGESLARLLARERRLSAARIGSIMMDAASALAAAHEAGVVHRDLKPDNVFLSRLGDREIVKLLDFGVAKIAGVGRLTRAGMVFGTPHYMSPEQAAGSPLDERADIYALGVIMYECFSGRVPFEADTYMGVLTKHMFAEPEPIDRVVPDPGCLGACGSIVMRCLAKRPDDRFSSMKEVAAALREALADPDGATTEVGRPSRTSESLRLREPTPPPVFGPSTSETPPPPVASLGGRLALLSVGTFVLVLGAGLLAWKVTGAGVRATPESPAPTTFAGAPPASLAPDVPEPAPTPTVRESALPTASGVPSSAPAARPATPSSAVQPTPSHAPKAKADPKAPRTSGDVVDPW